MPRNKRTITRDSVFRSSNADDVVSQGVSTPTATTRQTAMWLSDEEVDWLDSCCQQIRRGGWRGITRSALVRSLIQVAQTKPLDLSGVSGEGDLVETLRRGMDGVDGRDGAKSDSITVSQ